MNIVALKGGPERFSQVRTMINLTAEQIHLAKQIDAHVRRYPDTELGTEHLLTTIYDYMDAFKRIMDSKTSV